MCKHGGYGSVAWIDILNLESKVPLYNGAVYVKVLEVGASARNKLFAEDKLVRAIANLSRQPQQKSVIRNEGSPAVATSAVNKDKSVSPPPTIVQSKKEKSPGQLQKPPQHTDLIF